MSIEIMPVDAVAIARKALSNSGEMVVVPRGVLQVLASCTALGAAYVAELTPKPPPDPHAAALEAMMGTIADLAAKVEESRAPKRASFKGEFPSVNARRQATREKIARVLVGGAMTSVGIRDALALDVGPEAVMYLMRGDPWFASSRGKGWCLTAEGIEAAKLLEAV